MKFEWDEHKNKLNIQKHEIDFSKKSNQQRKIHLFTEGKKMKDEYDFSNAEQGKFYVPIEEIQLPVYLDHDVMQFLNKKCDFNAVRLNELVNQLLRKDIETAQQLAL